jgi:hypothetical protein
VSHPSPTSSERKFLRGVEQIKTLRRETRAFENRNAYVFRKEVESRTANSIRYRCFAVEREAPSDDWPLLAGEAIQNLRSALDHVIWAASKQGRAQFPIFTDPCEFQVLGSRMLQGVPETMRAAIEKAQPYRTTPQAPAQAMLEQLRILSNRDKHRTLATIASAVHQEGIGVPEGVGIAWEKFGTNQPLGPGETHISTFTATFTEAETEEVDVQPMFAYQVRIEGRPLGILRGIIDEAFRVLVECATGEPPNPFAPYPLQPDD